MYKSNNLTFMSLSLSFFLLFRLVGDLTSSSLIMDFEKCFLGALATVNSVAF